MKILLTFVFFVFSTTCFAGNSPRLPDPKDVNNPLLAVLPVGYFAISTYFIDDVDFKDITIRGLKNLVNIDKNFSIINEPNRLVIKYKSITKKVYDKLPGAQQFRKWSILCTQIIDDIIPISPLIARLRTGEMISRVFGGITAALDSVSRYVAPDKTQPIHTVANHVEPKSTISSPSVWSKLYDQTLYIRIENFSPYTAYETTYLLEHAKRTYTSLILDLRDNPGGRLEQAIEIADFFLGKGLISYSKGRHPKSWQYFRADKDEKNVNKPIVILVNDQTASAAEVLTAALKEHNRAVVIGGKTYGKGSIQRVISLPNQGVLILTWAALYSPKSNPLNHKGVDPQLNLFTDKKHKLIQLLEKYKISQFFINKINNKPDIYPENFEINLAYEILAKKPDLYQNLIKGQ
jgi:peptidase S41-like protein